MSNELISAIYGGLIASVISGAALIIVNHFTVKSQFKLQDEKHEQDIIKERESRKFAFVDEQLKSFYGPVGFIGNMLWEIEKLYEEIHSETNEFWGAYYLSPLKKIYEDRLSNFSDELYDKIQKLQKEDDEYIDICIRFENDLIESKSEFLNKLIELIEKYYYLIDPDDYETLIHYCTGSRYNMLISKFDPRFNGLNEKDFDSNRGLRNFLRIAYEMRKIKAASEEYPKLIEMYTRKYEEWKKLAN